MKVKDTFNNLKLGQKIGAGFAVVTLCFALTVLFSLYETRQVKHISDRIMEHSQPTVLVSTNVLGEINQSVASLRGYMILGHPKYIKEREHAWEQLDTDIAKMLDLSKHWTNAGDVKRLRRVESLLTDLKDIQEEIESLANSPENLPAYKLFFDQVLPKEERIIDAISNMIRIEKQINDTSNKRHQLFAHMTEFHSSLTTVAGDIEGFLLAGKHEFVDKFRDHWQRNHQAYAALRLAKNQMTAQQREFFLTIESTRGDFEKYAEEAIQIRASKEWNQSNHLLATKLNPIAADIEQNLVEIVKNETHQLENDTSDLRSKESQLELVELLSLSVILLLALMISYAITKIILTPVHELVDTVKKITEGDLDAKIQNVNQNELGVLGQNINTMVSRLKETRDQNEADQWLKSGQAEIANLMRGEPDLDVLAKAVITWLTKYINAQVGLLFLEKKSEDDTHTEYTLAASYAYTRRKGLVTTFSEGEGLLGQAVLEKEPMIIADEDNSLIVEMGIDRKPATHILIMPLVHEDQVKGVLEIGSTQTISDIELSLVKTVAENIAITISSAEDRKKMAELLAKTQQQAEEMQAQQEELKAANEELEEQTQSLRESEEKLKAQSEELQASNEELEEKSEDLKRQKDDIERKNEAIQQKNDEIEIAQKELEKKARDLSMASKYKSEFLANMSHELRTPLNSLLILSKGLSENPEGNLTDEQVEEMKVIHSGGQDLLDLINDVLDISKIEAGKLSAHVDTVKISSLINTLKNQFNPISKQRGVELIIDIKESAPTMIESDSQRIEQILKNLLSNAFKFTSEGSVTIAVSPADADHIAFSVIDTGIGIPQDKVADIFEAFQQADGSTSRKYGGTGLGLTISREMSRLLGGQVTLESREGKGSTFTLLIPAHLRIESDEGAVESVSESKTRVVKDDQPRDVSKPAEPKSKSGERSIPVTNTSSERTKAENRSAFLTKKTREKNSPTNKILIIEDDKNFARVLRKQAENKGYEVIVTSEGQKGLYLAFQHLPVGIILDLGLPDIDGLKVLEHLKEDIETRHIPVHVISGREDADSSKRKGAIGFLKKPTDKAELDQVFSSFEDLRSKKIKKVLVVEDDEANRNAVIKLIKTDTVDVTACGSGKEATRYLETDTFDCVVLDLGLPDIDGKKLLKEWEKTDQLGGAPVIIYTGKNLDKQEFQELQKYTDNIIVKGANSPERLIDEVALFLHSVEANLPNRQQQAIRMLHEPAQTMKGKKILLVDDDLRNTFALSSVLKRYGLEVVIADNGKLAIEKLHEDETVELVLMDIMMPIMDGYEAMKAIRSEQRFKDLPIIALTAKAMPEDRAKCIESGANDYLTKPVDEDVLISLMRVFLSGDR